MFLSPISALFSGNQRSQVSEDSDINHIAVLDFLKMPRSLRLLPDLRKNDSSRTTFWGGTAYFGTYACSLNSSDFIT